MVATSTPVNTIRISLIDEIDILEALYEGRVAGLALDDFDREPPAANPLLPDELVIAHSISAASPRKVFRGRRSWPWKICWNFSKKHDNQ